MTLAYHKATIPYPPPPPTSLDGQQHSSSPEDVQQQLFWLVHFLSQMASGSLQVATGTKQNQY